MFFQNLATDPRFFFAMVIAVVVSVCLHELAHGLVAVWLGDRTPIEQDRLTLNPFVHMGWVSLICLAIAGIAWGAMPVDDRRLRGRFAPAAVAAAGPITNAVLAAIALVSLGLWMRFDPRRSDELSDFADNGRYLLWIFGAANTLLAFFNLLPIPPLDGSRILQNFSTSFGHACDAIRSAAPMVFIQGIVLIFSAAGTLLTSPAVKLARSVLRAVRGW